MKMSVSSAFNRTACGSISSQAAHEYDNFMRDYYTHLQGYGGWVGEIVGKVLEEHDTFMTSRMWEFGRTGRADIGNYVGRYEIGYLRTLSAQQNAKGYMCSVIMANPLVSRMYEEGLIDGFSDEVLHLFCTGVGEDNYFYRKVTDSTLSITADNVPEEYKRYLSTRDKLTTLSEHEREDALRTWRATESFVNRGYDPTSITNGPIKSVEEIELEKKQLTNEMIH